MPRRGDNIRKRADGRWEGRYAAASTDGQKRYLSVYGKTYGEVKEKLTDRIYLLSRTDSSDLQASQISGGLQVCDTNFCVLMEEWLEEISQSRKYSTYIKYKKLYIFSLSFPPTSFPGCPIAAFMPSWQHWKYRIRPGKAFLPLSNRLYAMWKRNTATPCLPLQAVFCRRRHPPLR